MHTLKEQGFSLIELLIALVLASLVLSLFMSNLSNFALKSSSTIESLQKEDYAIAALMLLQHQVEAASITECTINPQERAYQILDSTHIKLQQLSATFYVTQKPETASLTTPNGFRAEAGQLALIDDCHHTLISPILSKVGKSLELAAFKPQDFEVPFSVSLIQTRLYFFANGALYLQKEDGNGNRNQVIPDLDSLHFTENGVMIDEKYHISF